MVSKKLIAELINKYFEKCPFCGNQSTLKISGFFTKSIECKNCFGKWKCQEQDSEEPWLKYIEPSANKEYNWLLQISRPFWFWANLHEVKEIMWEKTSKNLPESAKESIIMEPDENILATWTGKDFWEKEGVLLLTNRRLIWLRKQKENFYYSDALPLEFVSQIVQSTYEKDPEKAEKIIIIATDGAQYEVILERMLQYPVAKPVLEKAVNERKIKIHEERKKERLHIILDFSYIKSYLEKGGIILQTYKCPECGARLDFPEHGTKIICKYCNAIIKAEDVFRKIKDLIS